MKTLLLSFSLLLSLSYEPLAQIRNTTWGDSESEVRKTITTEISYSDALNIPEGKYIGTKDVLAGKEAIIAYYFLKV